MGIVKREAFAAELFDQIDSLASTHQLQLIDVEIKGQTHNPIVVVYLDKEDGIGIDDLAAANRWLATLLDEVIDTSYTLEVSSPGGRSRRQV
ncbi:MAG: hypothetical protein FWF11_04645 [Coriobacteriia bacterium]|nr:hypothetical protein [Coriobacteriia bacterium]